MALRGLRRRPLHEVCPAWLQVQVPILVPSHGSARIEMVRLEDLVTPFYLRQLQQPICVCCSERLTVERDAVMFDTTIEHRGWLIMITDREAMRADGDIAMLIRAWMKAEHSLAALALCGEILELWEGEYA